MARSTSSPGITAEPPAQVAPGARRRPLVLSLLFSLRPDQWTKNLLVFAGLLFGQQLFDPKAVAGAVAIDVEISHWLLVCTILLGLFIALAKRRHELVLLADGATSHRRILGEYSPYLLDQMISVVTASTLVAYMFYTISPETEQKCGTQWL